ncbi:MAG: diacylglycerol kinase family protein [Patescibacteria group bacterium]|jgi:diacylglycerol kinase family enzyme
MYAYLYDSFVSDARNQTKIARIETRLTDLGISGKINRLSLLTSLTEQVDEAIKKGVDTIVAVGNDTTLAKLIAATADRAVTFGYIPIGAPNYFARLLDIPSDEKACDVLSARVIERLDLGCANNHFFLSSAEVSAPGVTMKCDNSFQLKLTSPGQTIRVYNLGPANEAAGFNTDPRDARLDIVVDEPSGGRWFGRGNAGQSVFRIKRAEFIGAEPNTNVILDGQTIVQCPVILTVLPKKFKIVVGKGRKFA